jgi:hypothetical protein
MSGVRLAVLAFLITILIVAGVARGQGRYGLPEQGPQPLGNELSDREHYGLDGPKSISKSGSKATSQKAPRAAGTKKNAKGASPKPYAFGPAAGQYGMQQDSEAQIGASGRPLLNMGNNPGSTSFLDGYLLKSLHDDGLAREKPRREDEPKDDLLLQGTTSSKY